MVIRTYNTIKEGVQYFAILICEELQKNFVHCVREPVLALKNANNFKVVLIRHDFHRAEHRPTTHNEFFGTCMTCVKCHLKEPKGVFGQSQQIYLGCRQVVLEAVIKFCLIWKILPEILVKGACRKLGH